MTVVAEKITVTISASSAHIDVLTVKDAMRQVLDIFDLLESDKDPAVVWKLSRATTNSPFQLQGEAVSLEPSVDISVVARAQKTVAANGLREISRGQFPDAWQNDDRRLSIAKRILKRNLNGVGSTVIDFDHGEPVSVTPTIAAVAIRAIEKRPEDDLYVFPSGKQEIGSIEGTLQELGTHWNHPAVRVLDARTKEQVWCRLGKDLQMQFGDKATFKDIWEHVRVVVRGRIRYDEDGALSYVLASDIDKIEAREVSVAKLADRDFTGGLSVVEYLDRFREGTLG